MDPVPVTSPPTDLAPSELDERTRARILRAAVEVFDRKGYAGASVREIVEKAGVTKPALYYHFGSKEGVLTAILTAAMREFTAVLAAAAARPGSARQRLVGLCEEVYGLFSRNVPVVRVAHTATYTAPEGGPKMDLNAPTEALDAAIRQIVEEGVRSGELRPVGSQDLSLLVLGLIGESMHRELHGVRALGADSVYRSLDLIFEGVLARVPTETGNEEPVPGG